MNSLIESVVPLASVGTVIVIVYILFSIVGMSLLRGALNRCDIDDYYGVSKEQCLAMGQKWVRAYWNYDNILESMITLFILSTMEAWPGLVGDSMDSNHSDNLGPIYNNNSWILVFYFAFILIGTRVIT
jgi:hypothetical protein